MPRGKTATIEFFTSRPINKSGLGSICRDWARVRSREYTAAHPEENRARAAQWQLDHPEQKRQYDHDYYEAHKEARLIHSAQYAQDHPEQIRATQARFTANHPGRRKQIANKYARAHPEQRIKWRTQNPDRYRQNNKLSKHRRRALEKWAEGYFTQADLDEIWDLQDGRCGYCGMPLSWEIKGDIHLEHMIPLSRGGTNWPNNLMYSCQPCNLSKHDKTVEEWRAVRGW